MARFLVTEQGPRETNASWLERRAAKRNAKFQAKCAAVAAETERVRREGRGPRFVNKPLAGLAALAV